MATCVCFYAHVYGICLQLRLLTGRYYSFGCDVLSAVKIGFVEQNNERMHRGKGTKLEG